MGLFDPVPGKNFWYRAGYWLSRTVARAFFSFEVRHSERIPKTGGVILAMNHQSFLDPPFAGICAQRPLFFLARNTLLKIPLLGPILPKVNVIPVERGGADMSAMKAVIRMLKEGESTVVFPEGTRTKDGALQAAQPGLGLIIAKTMVPVVPMRVFGAFEAFPRTAKFPRMRPVTIVVGEPMIFTEADLAGGGREKYRELSERVMAQIAALTWDPKHVEIVGETPGERRWWLALGALLLLLVALGAISAAERQSQRGTVEAFEENSAVGDTAVFPAGEKVNRELPLVQFAGQTYFAADDLSDENDGEMIRAGRDESGKYSLYRREPKREAPSERLYLKVAHDRFLPLRAK